MANPELEIVFRGDIISGHSMVEVRERLRELFKADDAQLTRLFSGRAAVIRRNLDEAAASRYEKILQQAGAVVEIRPMQSTAVTGSAGEEEEVEETMEHGWVVAPVGSDILRRDERMKVPPVEIDASAIADISVAPVGSDVLSTGERSEPVEADIDISHLKLTSAASQE